jgi:hypothetical protein
MEAQPTAMAAQTKAKRHGSPSSNLMLLGRCALRKDRDGLPVPKCTSRLLVPGLSFPNMLLSTSQVGQVDQRDAGALALV